jgi:hypothetical protein
MSGANTAEPQGCDDGSDVLLGGSFSACGQLSIGASSATKRLGNKVQFVGAQIDT